MQANTVEHYSPGDMQGPYNTCVDNKKICEKDYLHLKVSLILFLLWASPTGLIVPVIAMK